ncbi:MAG TPA: DUF502 domain-containing protein [Polyangiaceae bacterium]|jgi:uncharacterized membrane protein|nr:DUF502 domain-containing protein [Polyangiaceae bacterium]
MTPRALFRYFVRGCLVAAPLGLTIYIVYSTLQAIDHLLPAPVPGLGLLITVALLTVVGFLTSNVVGRTVVDFTDRLLKSVPLVKLVYSSLKDMVGAFVGEKKSFNRPVTVRVGELKVLGFVTRDSLDGLALPGHVAVYFPQSYNFAGYLVLAPRELVEPVNVPSSELMTFIVSGGVSGLGVRPPVGLTPPPPATTVG